MLERRLPRVRLDLPPVEAVATLGDSYLFVQGPPGSGKTWQGAKMAVALMRAGKRVGVTSLSHKAINKLLQEIEREAREQGFAFKGRKKSTSGNEESRYGGRSSTGATAGLTSSMTDSSSWPVRLALFAREDFVGHLHTLFIDEAGQVDLLGEDETVPPERGIFLEQTWRLRPEICAFTSEAYYEGRLLPAAVSARRTLAAGDGLFVEEIQHAGRSQSSREEADAVAAAIRALLGTSFTDESGVARPIGPDDVLVVAPYNAQVRRLRQRLPAGVRVGTVDKFQGQEAPVVFVSMASSTAEDAPRGIGFAFDRHRVNVATSRAQCRVVLVCARASSTPTASRSSRCGW